MNTQRDLRQRRLLMILVALDIAMAVAIVIVGYNLYSTRMRVELTNVSDGAAKTAASIVDGDLIEGWLEKGADDEYIEELNDLQALRDHVPDIEYLYVYKIEEDGCHVVFDTIGGSGEPGKLGEVVPFDPTFEPYVPTLLKGGRIEPIESNDSWGWLMTMYEPVTDSSGKCVAYAGADISMLKIRDYMKHYIIRAALISLIFMALIIAISMKVSMGYYKTNEMEILLEQQQRDKNLITEIVEAFAKIIDLKDRYTNGHSTRVAEYTAMLARELGYNDEEVQKYYDIALMHDIGKIGVPDEVLNKPGKLTDEEYEKFKSHTTRGYNALQEISLMPELAIGAAYHHERPDGKGYPKGLKGDEIPRVAQIVSVADTFDAMYSDRPYRKRMDFDKVVETIKDVAGTQLAADVVDAFLRLVDKGEINASSGSTLEDVKEPAKTE